MIASIQPLKRRPKLVLMDCDGVIFDVNHDKAQAFVTALADYPPDAVAELVAHHKARGGISRYVKFRYFFETLHPLPAHQVDDAVAAALAHFGQCCRSAYQNQTARPAALRSAASFGGADAVVVVSGGDQNELRQVFDDNRLMTYFGEVCGSPQTKHDHVARLLNRRDVAPEEALFIGDGWGDWEVATTFGIPFIYLREMSAWQDGPATVSRTENAWLYEDWRALETAIASSRANWRPAAP